MAAPADFVMGDAPRKPQPVSVANSQYWPLHRLKRAYTSYLEEKRDEIEEQKQARRYYHGSQWTAAQMAEFRRRKQPVMTFNRTARKINGVVGVVERLRQDPKGYARTPKHEEGAELATATVRYVLDEQNWNAKSPMAALDGAVDGLAGCEIILEGGDQGDPEVGFDNVDPDAFFYDPRSFKPDFSDARYMGYGKWMLEEEVADFLPPGVEVVGTGGDELSSDSDRDNKWFAATQEGGQRVRVVDCWYKHKGRWCWALFTGSQILMEGESYLRDEKGRPSCKFVMYSAAVDQDGDRYGFVRNLKSPQDSLNAKQSTMHRILSSQRIITRKGAVADIEQTRKEWAKPDGVVVVDSITGDLRQDIMTDDQSSDFVGWSKMLELALAELEQFGPNPSLLGQGGENQSGRAIHLLQQANISELGPYMLAYKGWKIRLYRAVWNAIQQHWTAERWIRVTDDEGLAQFIQINGLGVDPATGMPTIVNAIGNLDVDIIMDEGPDTITMAQDNYETLIALGDGVPPEVKIELAPLNATTKKKLIGQIEQARQAAAQQPNPEMMKIQADMQAKQQDAQLQVEKAQADIVLKREANAADIQMKRESAMADMQIEAHKANQQMELERVKAAAQIEIQREKGAVQNAVAVQRAEQQAEAAATQS